MCDDIKYDMKTESHCDVCKKTTFDVVTYKENIGLPVNLMFKLSHCNDCGSYKRQDVISKDNIMGIK